jgi:hypothetical protein
MAPPARRWVIYCGFCGRSSPSLLTIQEHLMEQHDVTQNEIAGVVRETVRISDLTAWHNRRPMRGIVTRDFPGAEIAYEFVSSLNDVFLYLAVPFGENPGPRRMAWTWKIGISLHAVHVYKSAKDVWEPDFGLAEPGQWASKNATLQRARRLAGRYRLRILVEHD